MPLRPYQADSANAAWAVIANEANALIQLPTGTGKTHVIGELATRAIEQDAANRPAIVIAERDEIMGQIKAKLEAVGCTVFVEKGDSRPYYPQVLASSRQRLTAVVASVPTLRATRHRFKTKRVHRWPEDAFSIGIVDEAHHATAPSYQMVMRYLKCPWVGLTATAGRKGLARIFELAYSMTMPEAIAQGWLVPFWCREVLVPGLDLRGLRKVSGDVDRKELGRRVRQAMGSGILDAIDEHMVNRKGIVFWPSVACAKESAEWLRAIDRRVEVIHGKTPSETRRKLIASIRAGDVDLVTNCGVLTEGFDHPEASLIAVARPTLSMDLYTQMVGRGSRPLPGIVDGLKTADERKTAIAASDKPHCVLLDFAGETDRRDFASAVELLMGDLDAPMKLRAHAKAQGAGGTADEIREVITEEERLAEIERKRAEAKAAADERNQRLRSTRQRRFAASRHRAQVFDVDLGLGGERSPPHPPDSQPMTKEQRGEMWRMIAHHHGIFGRPKGKDWQIPDVKAYTAFKNSNPTQSEAATRIAELRERYTPPRRPGPQRVYQPPTPIQIKGQFAVLFVDGVPRRSFRAPHGVGAAQSAANDLRAAGHKVELKWRDHIPNTSERKIA